LSLNSEGNGGADLLRAATLVSGDHEVWVSVWAPVPDGSANLRGGRWHCGQKRCGSRSRGRLAGPFTERHRRALHRTEVCKCDEHQRGQKLAPYQTLSRRSAGKGHGK